MYLVYVLWSFTCSIGYCFSVHFLKQKSERISLRIFPKHRKSFKKKRKFNVQSNENFNWERIYMTKWTKKKSLQHLDTRTTSFHTHHTHLHTKKRKKDNDEIENPSILTNCVLFLFFLWRIRFRFLETIYVKSTKIKLKKFKIRCFAVIWQWRCVEILISLLRFYFSQTFAIAFARK